MKDIKSDFSEEKPMWPFSSYGNRFEPSILPGLDFSPEELRLEYLCDRNYVRQTFAACLL
jgi:hypothetical protein